MADDRQPETQDEDEALLRAAKEAPEGDLRAFEQLVGRHQNTILTDCRYLTRDDNNAEDLAQEVFVKAYFGLARFEGRSAFRHWLRRIKVNHCLNHIQRSSREAVSIDEPGGDELEELQVAPQAAARVESMEERERIAAVLDLMPSTLRVPLIMRDMDELSYEEIAEALGLGLSAVKMRIKRGRERFRELYGAGPEGSEDTAA